MLTGQHTGTGGVLGPGFWGHLPARKARRRVHKTPGPRTPPCPCVYKLQGLACGREKRDKDFIVSIFYCRIKLHLNIYNKYVLQQWAAEEQESVIKAQKNWH